MHGINNLYSQILEGLSDECVALMVELSCLVDQVCVTWCKGNCALLAVSNRQ